MQRSRSKPAPRENAVAALPPGAQETLAPARKRDACARHDPVERRDPAERLDPAQRRDPAQLRASALRKLWSTYRAKPTDEARNRLVEQYQTLVGEIVRRFAWRLPRSVDRGDLDTAANVGLMAAVQGFDASRGVPFESYCELRVKGALLDELRAQDWLPRPWRARLEQQKRVFERLRSEADRDPSDEAVSAAMGLPLDEYRQIFGVGMPGAAVGSMPNDDTGDAPARSIDVVPDTHSDAPGEKLTRDEILQLVAQKLTVQEYRIVYLKYWEDFSMREIGELIRLSESRVCKIHLRLIERLRDRFRAHTEGA